MAKIVKNNFKPVYYMVDTWRKENKNNSSGFYKKFINKDEAREICDINNVDDFGFYTNRFVIKTNLN